MSKRIFSVFWVLVFTLFLTIPFAQAADSFSMDSTCLRNDADFAEISQIQSDILKEVEDVYHSEIGHAPAAMPTELDFTQSIKIYVDTDVLALNTDDQQELMTALESGNHVWILSVPVDDSVFSVTLARGQELNQQRSDVLTAQEKEQIEQQAGKWKVTAIGLEGENHSYQQRLSAIISQNESLLKDIRSVVVLGGVPAFRYPIALAMDGDKAVYWVSLGDDLVTSFLDETQFQEEQKTGIYHYQALSDYARSISENETASDQVIVGGANSVQSIGTNPFPLLIGIFCAVCGVVLLLMKRSVAKR